MSGTKVKVSEKKPWCFLFLGTFPPKKQPEQVTQVGSMSLGMGQKIFLSMGPIEISGWVKGGIDYIVVYHHAVQGITNEQLNITRWFRISPKASKMLGGVVTFRCKKYDFIGLSATSGTFYPTT